MCGLLTFTPFGWAAGFLAADFFAVVFLTAFFFAIAHLAPRGNEILTEKAKSARSVFIP
jgi:hypothetical protein